jgi:hypothetical protein
VAVMLQLADSPRPSQVADAGGTYRAVAPAPAPAVDASAAAPVAVQVRAAGQPVRRAVGRQTLAPATPGIVEIRPLAVVPLETDNEALDAEAPAHMVVIAPIEVDPVRISQLDLVE